MSTKSSGPRFAEELEELKESQKEVLIGVFKGEDNDTIADRSGLAESTVGAYKSELVKKGFLDKESWTEYVPGEKVEGLENVEDLLEDPEDKSYKTESSSDPELTREESIIRLLEENEGAVDQQSVFSDELELNQSYISKTLGDLEERGVISRERNGRSKAVYLEDTDDHGREETESQSSSDLIEWDEGEEMLEDDEHGEDVPGHEQMVDVLKQDGETYWSDVVARTELGEDDIIDTVVEARDAGYEILRTKDGDDYRIELRVDEEDEVEEETGSDAREASHSLGEPIDPKELNSQASRSNKGNYGSFINKIERNLERKRGEMSYKELAGEVGWSIGKTKRVVAKMAERGKVELYEEGLELAEFENEVPFVDYNS